MSTDRIDRDEVVLAAVVRGLTNAEAAEVGGCSIRTVVSLKARHAARLATMRVEHAERLADALATLSMGVLDRLAGIVTNGTDRDAVAAARIMLAEARGWRDAAYVEERLAEVERRLAS